MKFEFSKAWCNRIAKLEGDAQIAAGVHAKTPNFPSNRLARIISNGKVFYRMDGLDMESGHRLHQNFDRL